MLAHQLHFSACGLLGHAGLEGALVDVAAKLGPMGAQGGLVGSPQQVIDRIGEYVDAGAQQVNIAFRPPVDWQALQSYIEEVMPAFR